jgi:GNAT superfamily N-acetyltransferase
VPDADADADVQILREAANSAVATELLQSYYEELEERFPGGFELAQTVAAPPEEISPPHGMFFIAFRSGTAIGCGAVRKLDEVTGEIKRMWVYPVARGQGIARRLLAALEGAARELGCEVARLDTSAYLPEALGLYRAAGYREIPAYNDNPYATHWLEKSLS